MRGVAEDRDPPCSAAEEDLSPLEGVAGKVSSWLHDDPRRRTRFDPAEIVMFCVELAVLLVIVNDLVQGFAVAGSQDVPTLIIAITSWAELPVSAALLGAALLGWFHGERCCAEVESQLGQNETGTHPLEERFVQIAQGTTSAHQRLRRSRLLVAGIGTLALITAVASLTGLITSLQSGDSFFAHSLWYDYAYALTEYLAVLVPAVGALIIATRSWARSSA